MSGEETRSAFEGREGRASVSFILLLKNRVFLTHALLGSSCFSSSLSSPFLLLPHPLFSRLSLFRTFWGPFLRRTLSIDLRQELLYEKRGYGVNGDLRLSSSVSVSHVSRPKESTLLFCCFGRYFFLETDSKWVHSTSGSSQTVSNYLFCRLILIFFLLKKEKSRDWCSSRNKQGIKMCQMNERNKTLPLLLYSSFSQTFLSSPSISWLISNISLIFFRRNQWSKIEGRL